MPIHDREYTYKQLSLSTQGRYLSLTSPFVRRQSCVWKCCWSGTLEKMLQSVLVQNSDTLKDSTVMFVLFTDCVNNRLLPTVYKHHEQRTVRNATSFGYGLWSIREYEIRIFGRMQKIYIYFFQIVRYNTIFTI